MIDTMIEPMRIETIVETMMLMIGTMIETMCLASPVVSWRRVGLRVSGNMIETII
jgi:hypothetical protein